MFILKANNNALKVKPSENTAFRGIPVDAS